MISMTGKSTKNVPLIVCVYDHQPGATLQVDARDERAHGQTDLSLGPGTHPHELLNQIQLNRMIAAAGTNCQPMVDQHGNRQGMMYSVTADMVPAMSGRGYTVNPTSFKPSRLTLNQAAWNQQQTAPRQAKLAAMKDTFGSCVKKFALNTGLAVVAVHKRLFEFAKNRMMHGLWNRDGSRTEKARRADMGQPEQDQSIEAKLAQLQLQIAALETQILAQLAEIRATHTATDTAPHIVVDSEMMTAFDQRMRTLTERLDHLDRDITVDDTKNPTPVYDRAVTQSTPAGRSDEQPVEPDREVDHPTLTSSRDQHDETVSAQPSPGSASAQRLAGLADEVARNQQRIIQLTEQITLLDHEDELLTDAEAAHRRDTRAYRASSSRVLDAVQAITNPTEAAITRDARHQQQLTLDADGQRLAEQRARIEAERVRIETEQRHIREQTQALHDLIRANDAYDATVANDPTYTTPMSDTERTQIVDQMESDRERVVTSFESRVDTQIAAHLDTDTPQMG